MPRGWLKGLGEHCRFIGGSFFDAIPEGQDAYVLKHVITDWDDAGARGLLQNVHRSMGPGATLLVIGAVVDPRNGKHRLVKLLDQENAALLPGRFRTQAELESLLASSDFELLKVHPTAFLDLQIVEARPSRSRT